jgi:hypothetical protein
MGITTQLATDRRRRPVQLAGDSSNSHTLPVQVGDLDALIHRQEPGGDRLLLWRRLRVTRRLPDEHAIEGVAAVLALDDALGPVTASALIAPDLTGGLQRSHARLDQLQEPNPGNRRTPPAIRTAPFNVVLHRNS